MGAIHGIYSNFNVVHIFLINFSLVLAVVLLVMGLARSDKRHLGDILAGTQLKVDAYRDRDFSPIE